MEPRPDRRVTRTRAALVGAFNHLVLIKRRQRGIKAAEIIAEANVGRSTFYEHYSNADAVMLEAIRHPFGTLADALTGKADAARLTPLLEHFWENRQLARDMFVRLRDPVTRVLTGMIEDRIGDTRFSIPARLVARQLAETALAPIVGWVTAEAPCTPEALAHAVHACAAAIRTALTPSTA